MAAKKQMKLLKTTLLILTLTSFIKQILIAMI